MGGGMGVGRWVLGILLCCLFAAASWYAVRALHQVRSADESVAVLSVALQRTRAAQKRLQLCRTHVRQAAALLAHARALGLDPDLWMRSSFKLDTGRELDVLLSEDPLIKRLRLEKERIVKEQGDTRALINRSGNPPEQRLQLERIADKESGNLLQQLEDRLRKRRQWIETRTQYTGKAVVGLLNDLSDSSQGAWFAPDFFELVRVSADRYEVRAQGTFLAPQQAGGKNAGAAP